MNIQKNGITLIVSDDEIRRLLIERLSESEIILPVHDFALDPAPRIGEQWTAQGGVYAGIARGREGKPDHHLIVGPELDGTRGWIEASEWAANLAADSFTDFTLPSRKEQALCFANVPELFKPESYWSSEQHASYSFGAYYQFFNDGYQGHWDKYDKLRARAVRRLPIQ